MNPQIEHLTDKNILNLVSKNLNTVLAKDKFTGFDDLAKTISSLPNYYRSVAATNELDINLTLNNLSSYFGNTYSWAYSNETLKGLTYLGANKEADVFKESMEAIKPHWLKIGFVLKKEDELIEYFESSGLEEDLEQLDQKFRECINEKEFGVMSYWVDYARNHANEVKINNRV